MSWAVCVWHKNQFILNSLRILFKLIFLFHFVFVERWNKQMEARKTIFFYCCASSKFLQWLNFNDIAIIKIYLVKRQIHYVDGNEENEFRSNCSGFAGQACVIIFNISFKRRNETYVRLEIGWQHRLFELRLKSSEIDQNTA